MKYDVLHNFISPVTGRLLCPEDYIFVGNREGIAEPSPALIDVRLDITKIRRDIDDISASSFVLKTKSDKLPNAQALDQLNNGFMYNTSGVISTTNNVPLPNLEYKNLWIGDSNNKPQAVSTIDINNLPSLDTTDVPTPTGRFVGKIWEGTSSGRPEKSSIVGEMFADITALNAKFLAGKFVMNSGLTASFPKAQFLNALTAGALVKTSSAGDGKLESVIINQDQILMGGANNLPESRARIGVENLPLLAEGKLWKGGANSIPESITTIDRVNLPNLTNNMVWQGNAQGRPEEVELNFAPVDATYIIKQPNATLTNAQVLSELGVGMAKIVAGGAFAIAIPDEDYATKATLEQIKAETEEFKNQAANSAEQAATSAEEASVSATEASASATEATTAAGEATAAAAEATGAATAASGSAGAAGISAAGAAASAIAAAASAGSASSSASDASSSASSANTSASHAKTSEKNSAAYLNQLLNTGITLTGEAYGSGKLSEPIQTKVGFSFFTRAELPLNPHLGMLLFMEK